MADTGKSTEKSDGAFPPMKLYHAYPFRSLRCMWLVEELEADVDIKFVKSSVKDNDDREFWDLYRAIVQPHGTIPALEVEGVCTLVESGAICLYLADLYGKLTPPIKERGNYYNWISYACSTVDSFMFPLYMQLTHLSEEKRDQKVIEQNKAEFIIFCEYLTKALEDREYICGEEFTAADCVVGYNMFWASVIEGGALMEKYANILAYYDRLKARPAYQRAFRPLRVILNPTIKATPLPLVKLKPVPPPPPKGQEKNDKNKLSAPVAMDLNTMLTSSPLIQRRKDFLDAHHTVG